MKPEIKTLWLEELTIQPQTIGCLKNSKGMCCLGVLSEVAARHGLGHWSKEPDVEGKYWFNTEEDDDEGILVEPVIFWAGLSNETGRMPDLKDREGCVMALTELNDKGFTFAQISDVIKHFF